MKIAIVGTGYVGLVSGTCFADMGIDVTCVDVDARKIESLRRCSVPFYEPSLEELVVKNHRLGRLHFADLLTENIDDYEVIFIAVGTPSDKDGSADLRFVLDVAREIGRNLNRYALVVVKSTVPVGTTLSVRDTIREELDKRGVETEFDVASNPEFLKEGAAVRDFMSPDRVVVGLEENAERAKQLMNALYKPFMLVSYRMQFTDIASAEMIKYASNAMLATRISFMNDIANLCERVGADINAVRQGVGSDPRIGNKFLYAGIGYGGSCFPKDVKALIRTAEQNDYEMRVLKAVEEVNERQKSLLFEKFSAHFGGDIAGKRVAMWGLSYKPETDDMREAPSLVLIELLTAAGVTVKVYDPIAMDECRRRVGDRVIYCRDKYEAVADVDALMLVTEWKEFRLPDFALLRRTMRTPLILDGRNIYSPSDLADAGLE